MWSLRLPSTTNRREGYLIFSKLHRRDWSGRYRGSSCWVAAHTRKQPALKPIGWKKSRTYTTDDRQMTCTYYTRDPVTLSSVTHTAHLTPLPCQKLFVHKIKKKKRDGRRCVHRVCCCVYLYETDLAGDIFFFPSTVVVYQSKLDAVKRLRVFFLFFFFLCLYLCIPLLVCYLIYRRDERSRR